MRRLLDVEDVHALELPSAPSIAPDGSQIVYVLRTTDTDADVDRYALWSVQMPDAVCSDAAPVQLTRGDADTVPTFSPDSRSIAFLRGSDGPPQLFVLPVDGGEAEQMTSLPLGAGTPVWSPDGSRIAFVADVDRGAGVSAPSEDEGARQAHACAPVVVDRLGYKADGAGLLGTRRRHVHVLDLSSEAIEQLTDGDWDAGQPAWSWDSGALAFSAALEPDSDLTLRSATYVLDLTGPDRTPRRVCSGQGSSGPVGWTRDGKHLLVAGQAEVAVGHTNLLRFPVPEVEKAEGATTGAAAPACGDDATIADPVDLAAALDRNVMPGAPGYPGGAPQLTADGKAVIFCIRDRGCTHLYMVAVDAASGTRPSPVLTGADLVVSGLSVAGGVDRAAVVVSDSTTYGEIAVLDLGTGELTRLTEHTATSLPEVELYRPLERTFHLSDGTVVHGWLLRDPAALSPSPLLLDVHGGPHNAWHPAADAAHPYHQALAARGWAVLFLNPRGSDGYGSVWYSATIGAWGLGDERDFLQPLDQLVAEGVADPTRLAVSGYSYGGFMTCWLTSRTDRFAAAITGGVVADLMSLAGTSDVGQALSSLEFAAQPDDERARVREQSPIERVQHVRTPTLILQGLADERCPAGQAEQWFSALRTRGVPTRMVLYPEGSHLFILNGRPSYRADYSRRLMDWTEEHVVTKTTERRELDGERWQRRLTELATQHKIPGASLGILRLASGDGGNDELVEAVHGLLSKDTGVDVTTETAFQIGSITKVWTATVVMQLVDEGKLDLDAPIMDVLPDLRVGDSKVAKKVTMRHLLTHTSGIDGDIFSDTGRGDDCLKKYVDELADAAQNHPLGATFSYCNSGFSLAGRVIEVLTGKTWDAVVRERLFAPLGLSHTTTLPEEAILGRAAVGHVAEPEEEPHPAPFWLLPRSAGPAGLINSTARDVAAFARMHLADGLSADGSQVLSAESVAAMQQQQTELPDKHSLGDGWGLGWILFGWDGQRLFGHDGNTIGQAAFLRILPGAGLVVVLLTNGGNGKDLFEQLYGEIFTEIAGLQMPAPLEPPKQAPDVDLARYVGVYERTSVTTEVFLRDGSLMLRSTSTEPISVAGGEATHEYNLVPVAEDLFVMRAPGTLTWVPVTFYCLPDSAEYVHYGVRANPKRH